VKHYPHRYSLSVEIQALAMQRITDTRDPGDETAGTLEDMAERIAGLEDSAKALATIGSLLGIPRCEKGTIVAPERAEGGLIVSPEWIAKIVGKVRAMTQPATKTEAKGAKS